MGKEVSKVRLLVRKGRDVLVLEKDDPKEKYSLIGGHVDKGETRVQSLIRESREEVNLVINSDELILLRETKGKKVMKYYYLLTDNTKSFKMNESHKFLDCKWVDANEAIQEMEKSDAEAISFHVLGEV